MAQKPETRYRLRVEKELPPDVYTLKLNLPYVGGIADSWYSGNIDDLWVEYKWLPKIPKRVLDLVGGKDPWISKLQQDWLMNRHREGRNVAVIVGSPLGGLVLPGLEWMSSMEAPALSWATKQQTAAWIEARVRSSTPRLSSMAQAA